MHSLADTFELERRVIPGSTPVWTAIERATEQRVTLVQLRLWPPFTPEEAEQLESALAVLHALQTPYLLPYTAALETGADETASLWLIQPHGPGPFLADSTAIDPVTAFEYTEWLLTSLIDLHARGLHHGALSPVAIQFKRRGFALLHLALGDATLAALFGGALATPFLAPELRFESAGPAADVYAVGAILAWMLTGMTIQPEHLEETGTLPPVWRRAIAFLLTEDPRRRPTAAEALRHIQVTKQHLPKRTADETLRSAPVWPGEEGIARTLTR